MTKINKIVIATSNQGKISELAELLHDYPIELSTQAQYGITTPVAETGTTFIENAIIKARYAAEITGLPTIADDSGIEIDALGGEPGVHSSSFSGQEGDFANHILKVIHLMVDIPPQQRLARFRCTLVFMRHARDPAPLIAQATWEGGILEAAQGSGGFGYDPIFYVPEFRCSAAELTPTQKNSLSHRGKALRLLYEQLRPLLKD
jgi:XTP/dITP diphosphohydrolase